MSKRVQYALKIIQYILAVIFLLSGIGKLVESDNARIILDQFFSNSSYNFAIIVAISIIELSISISLFIGIKTKWALSAAFVLILCFTLGLGFLYIQGKTINDCGCFGAFGTGMNIEVSLLKNFILIALIAGSFFLYGIKPTKQPQKKLHRDISQRP